jgi:hypothetical protein
MSKICPRCGKEKADKRKGVYCRPCVNEYTKERNAQNPYLKAHKMFKAGNVNAYEEMGLAK